MEWIDVKERMPEEFVDVLVVMDGAIGIGCWYNHASGCLGYAFQDKTQAGDNFAFQYWMPLPALPASDAVSEVPNQTK